VSDASESSKLRLEHVLEDELGTIQTPDAARAVVDRVERLAAGNTEESLGEAAAHAPGGAAAVVERAAEAGAGTPEQSVASVLATTAAEAVAPTPEAPVVVEAAQETLREAAPTPISPRAERGRRLLKEAVLARMGPLQAVDARAYMAVNNAPHPGWLDSVTWFVAIVTMGGWIWVVGTLMAYLLRVPLSRRALTRLLPSVVVATWIVEYPVKAYFRRRRPFAHIVRALVIGKKPGSWSFPSGHTASSFASAWVLTTVWPKRAPLFFGLASLVGLSRVYVGAHYPGDVLSGSALGVFLAEVTRQLVKRLFRV